MFYLIGDMAFGGTAEVTGEVEYSEEPVWTSSKQGELYPHRFPIRLEVAADRDEYPPASELVGQMRHTKKWPAEHWRLAFQGNVHRLPEEDYDLIRRAVEQKASAPVR